MKLSYFSFIEYTPRIVINAKLQAEGWTKPAFITFLHEFI